MVRVFRDERAQLTDRLAVPSQLDLVRQALLQHLQPQLLQPRHLVVQQLRRAVQHRAPPQRQSVSQRRGRSQPVTGARSSACGRHQPFEAVNVEQVLRDLQPVTGGMRHDRRGHVQPVEFAAQGVNDVLDLRPRGGRWRALPDRVDQVVDADHVVRFHQQCREHGLLPAHEHADDTVATHELDGPEQPEDHRTLVGVDRLGRPHREPLQKATLTTARSVHKGRAEATGNCYGPATGYASVTVILRRYLCATGSLPHSVLFGGTTCGEGGAAARASVCTSFPVCVNVLRTCAVLIMTRRPSFGYNLAALRNKMSVSLGLACDRSFRCGLEYDAP